MGILLASAIGGNFGVKTVTETQGYNWRAMDTLAKMGFIFIGQAICLVVDGKNVLTKAIAEISKTYRLETSSQFPGAKLATILFGK